MKINKISHSRVRMGLLGPACLGAWVTMLVAALLCPAVCDTLAWAVGDNDTSSPITENYNDVNQDGNSGTGEDYSIMLTSATAGIQITGGAAFDEQVTVAPGVTGYREHTIQVTANDISSYELKISGNTNLTGPAGSRAVGGADNTIGDNLADNTWGYAWGATNANKETMAYQTVTPDGATLSGDAVSNNSISFSRKLAFAAKFSTDNVPGQYTNEVTVSLVATPQATVYTLNLNPNNGTGGDNSKTCSTYTDSCIINLSGINTPTRTGYNFLGWADSNTATSAQYTTNGTNGTANTITLSAATTTNKLKTIYAVWESQDPWSSITTMQQMTTTACTAAEVGKEKSLTDSRDTSNSYKVRKMPDGKCWMTENLRIMNKSISSSDSNLAEGASFTIPASSTSGFSSDTASNAYLGADADGISTGYYTWCAATAGTCASAPKADDIAPSSICPKGWRLPTGGRNYTNGSTSEFYNLIMNGILKDNSNISSWKNNVSSNHYFTSSDAVDAIKGSPYNFAFTGYVGNSSYSAPASSPSGYWWSSTAYNSSNAYNLNIGSSYVYPGTGGNSRCRGFAVRCVAQ